MQTFYEWLSQLNLLRRLDETYYSFNPAEYNRLFDEELRQVITRTSDPAHRQTLKRMWGFDWMSYIAASVRHAGYYDQRENQERTHDVAVTLLTGKLFRGFDERWSGPMDLRFKRSVANAIRNLVEKERNRKRLLPTVPIQQEFEPGGVTADDLPGRSPPPEDDEKVVRDFRELVRHRLGELAVAIFDLRMAGEETKSLVGFPAFGSPGKYVVKRIVQGIKQLVREYAASLGDSMLLRRIERAMADEQATVAKRRAAVAKRRAAVAGAMFVVTFQDLAAGYFSRNLCFAASMSAHLNQPGMNWEMARLFLEKQLRPIAVAIRSGLPSLAADWQGEPIKMPSRCHPTLFGFRT